VAGTEDVPTNSGSQNCLRSADLEELYFGPEDDVAPGSMQPVIRINSRGERKIVLMRWGFKREDGKLLFNARAESINDVNFWKKSFSLRRCIVPADSVLRVGAT
jgi:putative SOS response-associated peptidase YedK